MRVRLSDPELKANLLYRNPSSSLKSNKVAAQELALRGRRRCNSQASTRSKCLLLKLPILHIWREVIPFRLRTYSGAASSDLGWTLKIELTILLCSLSMSWCRCKQGGHLVSRCCRTGNTARLKKAKRIGTLIERLDFEALLPKKARHIAWRVTNQHACVAPLS